MLAPYNTIWDFFSGDIPETIQTLCSCFPFQFNKREAEYLSPCLSWSMVLWQSWHINIKLEFSLLYGLNSQKSVKKALDCLGLEFQGQPHSGVDDAKNIAILYGRALSCRQQPNKELLAACKLALGAFENNNCIDWNEISSAIANAESNQ